MFGKRNSRWPLYTRVIELFICAHLHKLVEFHQLSILSGLHTIYRPICALHSPNPKIDHSIKRGRNTCAINRRDPSVAAVPHRPVKWPIKWQYKHVYIGILESLLSGPIHHCHHHRIPFTLSQCAGCPNGVTDSAPMCIFVEILIDTLRALRAQSQILDTNPRALDAVQQLHRFRSAVFYPLERIEEKEKKTPRRVYITRPPTGLRQVRRCGVRSGVHGIGIVVV